MPAPIIAEIRLQGMEGGMELHDGYPQITALADGGFVVTWHGDTPDGQSDIFVQRFDADGAMVGGTTRLQAMPGDLLDMAPQITALADGGFVVAWYGQTQEETDDGIFRHDDVLVQRFDADGGYCTAVDRQRGSAGRGWCSIARGSGS